MASVNKVIIVGNLGRDPDIRYTGNGEAVCNISVATTSRWKDKESGTQKEETEWHRVVMYKRLAEIAGEYLKKGRPIYIEGRLKTKSWEDDKGNTRYTTEIVADQMQMLGARDGNDQSGHASDAPDGAKSQAKNDYKATREGRGRPAAPADGGLADMDDDIPFD